MNSADDGSGGVFCQLKSLTQGLWGSPCSLKVFFGIIHRCVFAPPPKIQQRESSQEATQGSVGLDFLCGFPFPRCC